jgi:carboxyl-terminal processing protease
MKNTGLTCCAKRLGVFLLLAAVVATSAMPAWADPAPPSAKDRNIAVTFTALLRKEHISRRPLDREIYGRTVTQFLKMLDPAKVYFYQSDVDGFYARQEEVGKVARGDVQFAHEIFRVFLGRVDQRIKLIDQLLNMQHDFTVDERYVVDRDAVQFPKDEAEAFERWRQRIKYDLLVLKADRLEKETKAKKEAKPDAHETQPAPPPAEAEDPVGKLRRRYSSFAKRMHQVDSEELLEMYLTALSSSFDPHSSYMSPSTVENFDIQMGLKLEGIGAALRMEDEYTTVQEIIAGGPAFLDKRLKKGDRIVGVGQNADGPIEDVVNMKLSDVVKKIRGPAGTVVRLEVMPAHSQQKTIIQLTRAKIELKNSEARAKVFEEGARPDARPYKIGVIDLPSFYMDMAAARAGRRDFKSTTRDVRKILNDFTQQGVDALILDLRRNGGGSLQEAISLTGLFLGDGPVVQVKDSDGQVRVYNDQDGEMAWKGPLIVVVSKFSASASEILAGAIQDYRRGLIVGDHATHGKGTVQSLMDLGEQLFRNPFASKYGALKVTVQQFYRPNGDSTQQRGVLSDIELPSLTSHLDVAEGDLDHPIPFDRVPPAAFRPFASVNPALIDQLKKWSTERCLQSSDFEKVRRDIARYKQQKERKWVPLEERKFMEERAELNADKEEEKRLEEMDGASPGEIKKDFYLSEVMAIAVDYLKLLRSSPAPQAAQAAPPKDR